MFVSYVLSLVYQAAKQILMNLSQSVSPSVRPSVCSYQSMKLLISLHVFGSLSTTLQNPFFTISELKLQFIISSLPKQALFLSSAVDIKHSHGRRCDLQLQMNTQDAAVGVGDYASSRDYKYRPSTRLPSLTHSFASSPSNLISSTYFTEVGITEQTTAE